MRTPSTEDNATFLTAEAARTEIARQAFELQLLHKIRTLLSESDRSVDVIQQAVEALATTVGFVHVGAYQVRDQDLRLVHQVGYDAPMEYLPIDSGICGYVARTGEPVLVIDAPGDERYVRVLDRVTSEICVPFGSSDGLRGVLNVESDNDRPLAADDLHVVKEIAGMLTIAIERTELRSRQRLTERRLELALSAGDVGVWTWHPKTGSIEWIIGPDHSLSRLLPASTSISDLLLLLDAADVGHVQHAFAIAVTTGYVDLEFRLVDPTGTAVWASLHGQTVHRDIAGDPADVAGVITDITGRKRLEEERLRLMHLETARINAEESQKVLAITIERLADGFLSFNTEGHLLLINSAAAALLELDQTVSLGLTIDQVFSRVSRDHNRIQMIHAASDPDPLVFDLIDDRSGRILDIRTFPASDGITVHMRDVTDVRTAEYQRLRAENRFRSLVQQAFDIVVVMDRYASITYISPAVERVLGYSPHQLEHVDVRTLIHTDDQDRVANAFLRILRIPEFVVDMEFRVLTAEGTYCWLDVTMTNLLVDPSIQGIVANCRDVSERHAADFSMWLLGEVSSVVGRTLDVDQTIESLNHLLAGSYADFSLVAVLDENGHTMRRHCSLSSGTSLVDAIVDRLLRSCLAALEVRFGSEAPAQNTLVIGADDATELGIPEEFREVANKLIELNLDEVVIAPMTLRRSLRGILVVAPRTDGLPAEIDIEMLEEISRRAGLAIDNAELYEHAREAILARDRFLSVAAHELRTPITSVTGYATMLRKELDDRNDPDRLKRYAGRVDEAGRQLATLAEDLLDVSRIRSGNMPLRMGAVDLAALVRSVVARYRDQSDSARARLVLDEGAPSLMTFGDDDRLVQVLSNLIDNALKYSPSPEPVTIQTSTRGSAAVVSVSDRGIGVPQAELAQIFEPFGRATNAADGDIPGLGLGLYICRTIVERHEGQIFAESAGLGTGLTVTIRLPLVPDATASI